MDEKIKVMEKEINYLRIMILDMGKEIQDIKAEFKNHLFDITSHRETATIKLPSWLSNIQKKEIIDNESIF